VKPWAVVFAKQAVKDARKLATAGFRPKAQVLLDVLRQEHRARAAHVDALRVARVACASPL
jgi:hypothetical protein